MQKPVIRRNKSDGPEAIIQAKIVKKLRYLDWYCKETHGNIFQSGLPDVFACHRKYSSRWIEVKNPLAYRFTPAQIETFPMFAAKGVGIWILTSDDDSEINKLFKPANWIWYLSIMK